MTAELTELVIDICGVFDRLRDHLADHGPPYGAESQTKRESLTHKHQTIRMALEAAVECLADRS
ncbi:MAG: hypothetical protein O6851_07535 [Gemmatimonadetes bacterium]|nr:hypothetical protein [Gemmatimonadota bacterium]